MTSQLNRPMKILTLCYEYPPVGGGGGRVAAAVAAGLASKGHSVKVVSAGMKHLPKHAVINGVEVYRPNSFRRHEERCTVFEMALYIITSFGRALWISLRWRPDVIHVHFIVPSGVLAFLVSILSHTPYVITAHLGDVPGGVPEQTTTLFRVVNPFAKLIVSRAKAVTAVSTFVRDLLVSAYKCTPVVIVNGIDLTDAPQEIDSAVELRIVMVGRMSIQKNPLMAVEACGRLKSDAWHLHLVGNGPLIPEVEALVAKLGLERHVTFHGWLDALQVQRLLRESDVMLMPSRSEGMPVAAIEALKHGVAIIGSRIPGLQDVLLDNKTGIACDMSAESFSQALERVMLDASTLRNLRIGAQQHSINFNLDTIVHRYQECMLRTIN